MEKTASLIPEFYFDLIARILPGVVSLYFFTHVLDESLLGKANSNQSLDLLYLLFVLCESYVLGLILDLAGNAFLAYCEDKDRNEGRQRHTINPLKKLLYALLDWHTSVSHRKYENPIKVVVAYMASVENPQIYGLLLKMCAELILLRSLFITSFCIWLLVCLTAPFNSVLPSLTSDEGAFAGFAALLLMVLCRYFSDNLHNRVEVIRRNELKKYPPSLSQRYKF